jgi:hypothetical protein
LNVSYISYKRNINLQSKRGLMNHNDKSVYSHAVKQVLARMGEARAWGEVTPDGSLAVFTPRNRSAAPVCRAAPDILREMMAEELLITHPGKTSLRLISPLGRARLRRAQAQDAPFRAQHQSLRERVETDALGRRKTVRVNSFESPLGSLIQRRDRKGKPLISLEQFAAGEKFRRDFTLANLTPRLTGAWDSPVAGAKRGGAADAGNLSETVLAAKSRLSAALAVLGPGLEGIALLVCCHLSGLEDAERQLGWPARSGKVVLGIALDRLAAHYGITPGCAAKTRRRVFEPDPK